MAMVKCRECGADVSSRARNCQNCGIAKPAKSGRARTAIIAFVLGLLFIGWMAGGGNHSGANTLSAVGAFPIQPASTARADSIAFYNRVIGITGPCDLAEGVRAIAMQ